jgi:hypothetical protein
MRRWWTILQSATLALVLFAILAPSPAAQGPGPAADHAIYVPWITFEVPSPCTVGQVLTDPADDVALAHVDLVEMQSALEGDTLSVTLHLRDLPATLTFDRAGLPRTELEYAWGVYIDADADPATGNPAGAEYALTARHTVYMADLPVELPIADGVQTSVEVWEDDGWRFLGRATLAVDAAADTLTLTGDMPGLSPHALLMPRTYDANPGGEPQEDTAPCD